MKALFVVFVVAGTEYVVPALDVVQMESFEGATHVPGAPEYVAGLMQIRGQVVPVVDLRARFGLPRVERTLDTRVIVVLHDGRTVALLVDQAREVLALEPDIFTDPPAIVMERARGFVTKVARVGQRLVLLIDSRSVIGEEKLDGQRSPSK